MRRPTERKAPPKEGSDEAVQSQGTQDVEKAGLRQSQCGQLEIQSSLRVLPRVYRLISSGVGHVIRLTAMLALHKTLTCS